MKMKKYGNTEQKIYSLVKPITDELGYFIWDISFVKEGAMWYLRVFIDRDEGISIEDCEKVTAPVSEMLDIEDPIEQSYILEVGSAGLERELLKPEHFEVCKGDVVQVRLIRTIDGEKDIIGNLISADKESIIIQTDEDIQKQYMLSDVAHVKLHLDFA
ncbi:MAG: ribosome maturation factor RimP [Oscillospiraceae bacterium]|nr:ribosome maturation factor RimP [Oscillospiraceae bacterium]